MIGDKKNIQQRRKPKNPQKENLIAVDGRDTFQTPNYATELLVPFIPKRFGVIWECAVGQGKIQNLLVTKRFYVYGSDIELNFLTVDSYILVEKNIYCIITNPPFSLKRKFYERCREMGVPFALLIPADYSGWIIKATQDGCEKIIPTRRIDYITPTGLSGENGHTSYFHSMWLTWGFNLGKSETFVELTNQMKKNI
jgi:hypothetical protein